jgi:hypothetical protein
MIRVREYEAPHHDNDNMNGCQESGTNSFAGSYDSLLPTLGSMSLVFAVMTLTLNLFIGKDDSDDNQFIKRMGNMYEKKVAIDNREFSASFVSTYRCEMLSIVYISTRFLCKIHNCFARKVMEACSMC